MINILSNDNFLTIVDKNTLGRLVGLHTLEGIVSTILQVGFHHSLINTR